MISSNRVIGSIPAVYTGGTVLSSTGLVGGRTGANLFKMSTRTILFYDGDCGFCQASVDWLAARDRHQRLEFIPYQNPDNATKFPGVDLTHADAGVQVLLPNGQTDRDEGAIGLCLHEIPGWRWLGSILRAPVLRPVFHLGYRWVARNRRWISRLIGREACRIGPR
jgi:predicted DCC family thiol-disulfide oxidoreductase YuxK